MMNLKRKEPFAIDISFDFDTGTLDDFTLSFCQAGKILLAKSMEDAAMDENRRSACVMLSGEETSLFRPADPLYAQVRAVLAGGECLYSEAAEINVVDVLGT